MALLWQVPLTFFIIWLGWQLAVQKETENIQEAAKMEAKKARPARKPHRRG